MLTQVQAEGRIVAQRECGEMHAIVGSQIDAACRIIELGQREACALGKCTRGDPCSVELLDQSAHQGNRDATHRAADIAALRFTARICSDGG
jgi:hypothetical protein